MHALSSKVEAVLQGENISYEELRHMLASAAICTKDGCNRRYHHWLFRIEGGVVEDMKSFDPVVVGVDRGMGTVEEECDLCDASAIGCTDCGWRGTVQRYVWPTQKQRFR